jgi:hypothetical protein
MAKSFFAAVLAGVTLVAMAGLILSFLATFVITVRLNVLTNRLQMPFHQRLRYGWAGPLSMCLLRDHPNEQVRRWARWLGPAAGSTVACGLIFFAGSKVLGLPV